MLDPGGNEWHFPCCAVVRRRRLPLPKTDLKGKRDSHACNDFVSCGRCDINLAWLEGRDVTGTPIILEFYANLLASANERLGEAHLVQVVWVFITHRLILQGCFPCCLKDTYDVPSCTKWCWSTQSDVWILHASIIIVVLWSHSSRGKFVARSRSYTFFTRFDFRHCRIVRKE
jgi:hypothetical protein